MNLIYRQGTLSDVCKLKNLALKSWREFMQCLTGENREMLQSTLTEESTYTELLDKSYCIVCENNDEIIGMVFLVPNGNPTEIYDKEWSYIRFLSVDPDFGGQGIGRKLTTMCIDKARENKEKTIALHTSELMITARYLYESLGFKIVREIEPRLGKRYWLYKLDL